MEVLQVVSKEWYHSGLTARSFNLSIMAKSSSLFFSCGVLAEHVISVATTVGSQTGHISLKPNQEVEFVGSPQAIPWMVALAFLSSRFEGKGKACSTSKLKGQVGVSQSIDGVE